MTDDLLLSQLAEEFTHRVREGKLPDVEEYASRYPELAARIRELFPTLMLLEGAAASSDSAAEGAPLSPLTAGSAFGNYQIKREIGRGGMGIVYEADHVLLEKRVALKVLLVRMLSDGEHLERFFREARTAAGLHHTNIIPVFDVGQVAGTPYFAMEYIEGRSLDQIIRIMQSTSEPDTASSAFSDSASDIAAGAQTPSKHKIVSRDKGERAVRRSMDQSGRIRAGLPAKPGDYFRWVAGIGVQAAAGLAYAHERKIIHRDIKPSNLLLDKQGVLWIADFGLARRIEDPAMTQSGAMLGTPRYMSPEQAEAASRPIDQRSDIYSLGVTLYELLTCRPVFEGKTPQEVMTQIVTREPVAPRRLNREIPADLETVALKAMAKRPEDRYQSASELAEDLDHWQKMEPIKARPIGPLGRTIRWCRRNPKLAAVVAAAAAIIVILCTVFYWRLILENANTRLALQRETEARNQIAGALRQSEASKQQAETALSQAESARKQAEAAQAQAEAARAQAQTALAEAGSARAQASDSRKMAEENRSAALLGQLPARAISLRQKDPELSLLLALEAAQAAHTEEVEQALREALVESNIRAVFPGSNSFSSKRLQYPAARIVGSDFSPDGRMILTLDNTSVHLWDKATGQELKTIFLNVKEENVQNRNFVAVRAAFSCNGRRILTCERPTYNNFSESRQRLWDVATGNQLFEFAGEGIFSSDGRHFALVVDFGVQLWDLETGKVVAETPADKALLKVHAVSNDSKLVAIENVSGFYVWDTHANRIIAELKGKNRVILSSAAFSPDGKIIAAAWRAMSEPRTDVIKVWNVSTGVCIEEIKEKLAPEETLWFSSDQRLMVAGCQSQSGKVCQKNNAVRIWDTQTWQKINTFHGGGPAEISPDGKVLIIGGEPYPQIWDVWSGKPITELRGNIGMIETALFSHDGRQVLIGSADGTAKIWDVRAGLKPMELIGLSLPAEYLAFSSDASRLMAAARKEKALVWETKTGTLVSSIDTSSLRPTDMEFSPDGKSYLITRIPSASNQKGCVQLYSIDTRQIRAEICGDKSSPIERRIRSIFSYDGRLVVTLGVGAQGAKAKYFEFWDAATAKLVTEFAVEPRDFMYFGFSPDEKYLITLPMGGPPRKALLWDMAKREKIADLTGFADSNLSVVSFTSDSKYLVGAMAENSVGVWQTATGNLVAKLKAAYTPESTAAFSPDGKHIVISERVQFMKETNTKNESTAVISRCSVWETGSWQKVAEFNGLANYKPKGSFSPDGRFMVINLGSVARVVELATGKKIADLARQRGMVIRSTFSPNGKFIAVASENGSTLLYPWEMFAPYEDLILLARSRVTRKLSCEERNLYLQGPPCPAAK
jgi:serine/threonine protein kinase/WD40 repeat protein